MLSDAEYELERELGRVRAELIRERRARELRSAVNALGASTTAESDRAGVAEVIAGGASSIFDAGWTMVGYTVDDSMVRLVHGPSVPELIADDWVLIPIDTPVPICDVLRSEVDQIELADSSEFVAWPDMVAERERAQMESFVVRRISGTGEVAAVIAVAWPEPHVMDDLERELLDLLATTSAPAFRRSGRSEIDAEMARTLQEWLLQSTVYDVPGVDVEVLYEPGGNQLEVGGDWYDVVDLGAGRSAVVVGDVVGHDVQAAVAMSQVRHVLVAGLFAFADVAAALDLTDQYLRRRSLRTMATAVVIVFEGDGEVVVASAGHPRPLIVAGSGGASELAAGIGPPLGSGLGGYQGETTTLLPGSTIVAFTDGVVERRGQHLDVGIAQLRDVIETAVGEARAAGSPTAATVLDGLRAHLHHTRPDDDTAVVVLHVHDDAG